MQELTDAERIRRLPWLVLASLANNIFCVLTFVGSIFILFLYELGLDKTQIGFLAALIPFSQATAVLVGPWVARVGLKRSFFTFYGLRIGFFGLMLLTPWVLHRRGGQAAFTWVAGVLLAFALVRSINETALWSWSRQMIPDRIRGKFSAINTIISTMGILVAVAGAGYVVGRFSGLNRFLALIGAGLLAGAVSLVFYSFVPGGAPTRNGDEEPALLRPILRTLTDRHFLWFLSGYGLASMAFASLLAFLPLFMKEQVGLSVSHVIWLDVASQLGSILTCYAWGWASDRYGSKPVTLSTLALALLLPFCWFSMPRHHPLGTPLAMAFAALAGAANIGWIVSANRYLFLRAIPLGQTTSYMAVFFAWAGIVGGAGPLLAGRFLDFCAPVRAQWLVFNVDSYSPLFALGLLVLLAAIYAFSHIPRDGSMPTPAFVGMFLHGSPLLALGSLVRHKWPRDEQDRILTTERLGHARTLLSADELIEALNDPSFNVRYEAVIALSRLPSHPRLVEALTGVLAGDQPELSLAAAWALARLGDPSATAPLRQTLRSDYPLLQARSARALGLLGDVEDMPFFLEKLRDPALEASLRVAYAAALGALRAGDALPDILNLLDQSDNRAAREELALAAARVVSTEPHYVRLRRRLLDDLPTAAAQIVLNFKHALPGKQPSRRALRALADQSADAFARGDLAAGLDLLTRLASSATDGSRAELPPNLVRLLDESLQRVGQFRTERFEYVVLLFYATGRVLRHLHDQRG